MTISGLGRGAAPVHDAVAGGTRAVAVRAQFRAQAKARPAERYHHSLLRVRATTAREAPVPGLDSRGFDLKTATALVAVLSPRSPLPPHYIR